jgi:hypothetical protein
VIKHLAETMWPTAIARQLGIARSSVYRVLGARACAHAAARLSRQERPQGAVLAEVPRVLGMGSGLWTTAETAPCHRWPGPLPLPPDTLRKGVPSGEIASSS